MPATPKRIRVSGGTAYSALSATVCVTCISVEKLAPRLVSPAASWYSDDGSSDRKIPCAAACIRESAGSFSK